MRAGINGTEMKGKMEGSGGEEGRKEKRNGSD